MVAESLYVVPGQLVTSMKPDGSRSFAMSGRGWHPRNGQWVLFKPADGKPIPLAHQVESGHYVGIFQKAAVKSAVTVKKIAEKTGEAPPQSIAEMMDAHICVVNGSGENCPHINAKGTSVSDTLRLGLADVVELQPLLDRNHVPEERRDGTHEDGTPKTNPDWVPHP